MSIKIHFSVLSYYPSLFSAECINLGVLAQSSANKEMEFASIKKWNRVATFDDEVDTEILKLTLEGIKDQLKFARLNSKDMDISKFTRFFVNELKFSQIQTIESNNFSDGFELLKKIHLRYDFNKSERLNDNDSKKYLKLLFNEKCKSFNSNPIVGKYSENIRFDFVIDNKKCIKLMNISKKNKSMVHNIKAWAFDCIKLSSEYEVIFLLNIDDDVDKTTQTLIGDILSDVSATAINYQDYIKDISCELS